MMTDTKQVFINAYADPAPEPAAALQPEAPKQPWFATRRWYRTDQVVPASVPAQASPVPPSDSATAQPARPRITQPSAVELVQLPAPAATLQTMPLQKITMPALSIQHDAAAAPQMETSSPSPAESVEEDVAKPEISTDAIPLEIAASMPSVILEFAEAGIGQYAAALDEQFVGPVCEDSLMSVIDHAADLQVTAASPTSEAVDLPEKPAETKALDSNEAVGDSDDPSTAEETVAGEASKQEDRPVLAEAVASADDEEVEATTESDSQQTVKFKSAFRSEWEVDRFVWPLASDRLGEAQREYFEIAGHRLATATRDGLNILGIVSSQRGEGTSTLVMTLARCAAAAGINVALVDAHFANPALADALSVDAPCNWTDVADGELPLSEGAVWSVEDQITLFPLLNENLDSEVWNQDGIATLLARIAKEFQLVILDLGSLNAELVERLPIDAAIVVRDVRHTSDQQIAETAARLTEAGIQSVGIAENFADVESPVGAAESALPQRAAA